MSGSVVMSEKYVAESNKEDHALAVMAIGDLRVASAQRHYRIELPLKAMHRLYGTSYWINKSSLSIEMQGEAMVSSDVLLQWSPASKMSLDTAVFWKSRRAIRRNGTAVLPPVYVMDMDDLLEGVQPFNETFACYGIRDWDGRFLEPGDKIKWVNADGSETVIWEDKKTPGQDGIIFDIERNHETIGFHYDSGRYSHGVTVTTEMLASHYREQGVKNVYVFPNSVDPALYLWPDIKPHEGVRLLWEGGASHMSSWLHIRHAFVDWIRSHPEVKLVVFGSDFQWMKKEIPETQLELHGWRDYAAYDLYRACLDCDINFAPLADAPFTNCKSAIRWYEASMGPKPEATVAAKTGPYLEIEDGVTGLLYSNEQEMCEKLTAAVKNVELRKTLAQNAQKWVLDNRHVEKTVPGLHDFYQDLKARQRKELLK